MEVNHNSCMEITLDTKIEKILETYPSSSSFFAKRGLVCYICGEAFWEHRMSCARKKVQTQKPYSPSW